MKIQVNNLEIFYQVYGKGDKAILLLHGWGQSHAFWTSAHKEFSKGYRVYILDLPGFGLSQEPPNIWLIKDYANFIHAFVTEVKINNPIIIGHSFGGRIATIYATKYPTEKLILYSNGGILQKSIHTFIFKHIINQTGKYLFPNQLYKIHTTFFKPKQYQNKVIIERKRSRRILDIYTVPFPDLQKYFMKITIPTLILIGSKDFIVSPHVGRKIHDLIKNSSLVEVNNATHFAHIEAPEIFYKEVTKFLSSK